MLQALFGPPTPFEVDAQEDHFFAVQLEEAASGRPLPPSTLRAMLSSEAARGEASTSAAADGSRPTQAATGEHGLAAAGRPRATQCGEIVWWDNVDIMHSILSWLDAPTLWALPAVSRELGTLAASDHLWRALLHTHYQPVRWALPCGVRDSNPQPSILEPD